MKKLLLHASMALVLLLVPHVHFGQAPNLGAASSFAVFTGAGAFDNVLNTIITGDVGTNVGPFTGFPPGVVIGQTHIADAVSAQASAAVNTAFAQLAGTTCGAVIGIGLGNSQTLTPGVYCTGAASTLTGNLNLDAEGNPNAIFIIQIDGAFSSTTSASVTLLNGASACNVYWQINGAVSLGTSTAFVGTALINGAINLAVASVQGRLLSRTGAVSLENNLISIGALPAPSTIVANSATTFCAGGSVMLSGNVGGVWSTSATTPSIVVTTSGDYYVTNSNTCGSILSNHIIVTVRTPPVSNAGANQVICPSSTTTLTANAPVEGTGMWSVFSGPSTSIAQFSDPSSPVSFFTPAVPGPGDYVLTWTVTNPPCPPASSNVTVSVANVAPPSIICPLLGTVQVNAPPNQCCAVVNFTPATATDNCGGLMPVVTQTGGLPSGSCFTGTSQVTFQATSGGLISTCAFTVTVPDNQPPTITCPTNIVKSASTNCQAQAFFAFKGISDNCAGVIASVLSSSPTAGLSSGSNFPLGATTVIYQATDGAGLTKSCTFRVTVNDRQAPVITCAPDQAVNTATGQCSAVVTYADATFIDNCTPTNGTAVRMSGLPSGAAFPKGTTNVVYRATDASGNLTLCTVKVTVTDNEKPKIGCPTVPNRNTDPGKCGAAVSYSTPVGMDNCAGVQQQLLSGLASGSIFPVGTTTVLWQAKDAVGLTETCQFTVTVVDNQAPTIICPPNTTIMGGPGACTIPKAQLPTATAQDNCSVTSLSSDAPASVPAGTITVTWTALDGETLQAQCQHTVTVMCGTIYELGVMSYDAERESSSSLLLHTSYFTLSPNPASGTVVITLSNQHDLSRHGINNPSHQQPSGSNQHINPDHSSGQAQQPSHQQLIIRDALGRLVWSKKVTEETQQVVIDLEEAKFVDGIYQISLYSTEGVVTKSLVVSKR